MSSIGHISDQNGQSVSRPPLSDEAVSVLEDDAQDFFARQLSPWRNDLIDKLERQQHIGSGISLKNAEIQELTVRYEGVVRRSAQNFCEKLAKAVGRKQGLGTEEESWVRTRVEGFVREKTSSPTVHALFSYAVSSDFHIENQAEAEGAFCDTLAHLAENTRFLMLYADRALKEAAALYPKGPFSAEASQTQTAEFSTLEGAHEAEGPQITNGNANACEPGEDEKKPFKSNEDFSHSPDYRTVSYKGQKYNLTPHQAKVIEMLHYAYKNRNPEVGQAHVLEELGTPSSRLRDTFKGSKLWGTLIICLRKPRGLIRLALPDTSSSHPKLS